MTLLHTHNYIFVSVAEQELTNSVAFHQQATILIVMSWDKKLHQQFPFHATNSTILFYIKLSIMCKLSHRKFYILHVQHRCTVKKMTNFNPLKLKLKQLIFLSSLSCSNLIKKESFCCCCNLTLHLQSSFVSPGCNLTAMQNLESSV